MNTNLVLLLSISALISGGLAVVALIGGWGLTGAFLIYSLGGSMTLVLSALIANFRGESVDDIETPY